MLPVLKRQESAKDKECSVLLRRVKRDRKLDGAEANRDQKPNGSSNETITSPKGVSGRTRSNQQRPGAERKPCLDAAPQQRSEPERSSRQRSKNQTQYASRPPEISAEPINPPKSPNIADKTSSHLLCDYELPCTRRRRGNAGSATKGLAAFSKSEVDHEVSSNPSPESPKEKKKSRATRRRDEVQEKKKESRRTKPSPPEKPSSRVTQPGRKHPHKGIGAVPHERDEDEWTEDEILKLQEYVKTLLQNMSQMHKELDKNQQWFPPIRIQLLSFYKSLIVWSPEPQQQCEKPVESKPVCRKIRIKWNRIEKNSPLLYHKGDILP